MQWKKTGTRERWVDQFICLSSGKSKIKLNQTDFIQVWNRPKQQIYQEKTIDFLKYEITEKTVKSYPLTRYKTYELYDFSCPL